MVVKKRCVAMLLAGGQGSRLGILTKNRAKPAIPYGGKYRIIDFTLSNCVHSGIDTVGVLTQYQPFELNAYLGTGAAWDLDSMNGGVFVLPPFLKEDSGKWYSGTADAIYQNMNFVERYAPEHLIVLSGDHIYKMDYSKMIDFHERKQADATIAVIRVPLEEASRFGIMNTDAYLQIEEFDEKPEHPKNDMASMGVYVFRWEVLRRYLIADSQDEASANDFGKNIIPKMLHAGERMFAYPFSGYWKDVGTVESLWQANMELLSEDPPFILRDPAWKIYSQNPNQPPHYVGEDAKIVNSMVTEGCYILGTVENSVLFYGVTVEEGAVVKDSVIMPEVTIGKDAMVRRAIVDEGAVIEEDARIGSQEITVVGAGTVVAKRTEVAEETDCSPKAG